MKRIIFSSIVLSCLFLTMGVAGASANLEASITPQQVFIVPFINST